MNPQTNLRNVGRLLAVATVIGTATAIGQFVPSPMPTPMPSPIPQKPQSYANYYNQQLHDYLRPPVSGGQYIIDQYFYHRPTLSPYLNLTRRVGAESLNTYDRYVRPEIQRREQIASRDMLAASVPPPAMTPPGNPGHVPVNPYYDQYYSPEATGKMPPPPTPLPPKATLPSATPAPTLPLPKLYP